MTRNVTRMTIWDVEHYTDDQRQAIIDSYPEHERDARTKGIPLLGSGAVYPVPEERLKVEPFEIPRWWPQIGALDFGWDHPTAAVRIVWDRDTDVQYLTHEYRRSKTKPLEHAAALKAWGSWLPWAWPHDGLSFGRGGDEPLAQQYREHGLEMLPEPASFADGGRSVEAGIMYLLDRMQSDRFKVFSTCKQWFEEHGMYHRKDGRIVEEADDLMDATRYAAVCCDRFAQVRPAERAGAQPLMARGGW